MELKSTPGWPSVSSGRLARLGFLGRRSRSAAGWPWLIEDQGKYYNFYNAANGSIEQMGVALSDDLLAWKRYEDNYDANPSCGIANGYLWLAHTELAVYQRAEGAEQ